MDEAILQNRLKDLVRYVNSLDMPFIVQQGLWCRRIKNIASRGGMAYNGGVEHGVCVNGSCN